MVAVKKKVAKSTLELVDMIEGRIKKARNKCEEIRSSIYHYSGGK